jgi:hypothetical protein
MSNLKLVAVLLVRSLSFMAGQVVGATPVHAQERAFSTLDYRRSPN